MLKTPYLSIAKLVIILGYGFSIPGLWMMRDNPDVFQVSWMFTTLSVVLLMAFHRPWRWDFMLALTLVGVLGWLAEVIGVNTGVVFGSYSYGPSLGYKLFGTPIAKVVNWMLSVYMLIMIVKRFVKGRAVLVVVTAIAMVLYDIMLEPVAIRLQMWSWEGGTPPIHNYLGWFILSLAFAWILSGYVRNAKNPLVVTLFACQLVFLAALNYMIFFAGM